MLNLAMCRSIARRYPELDFDTAIRLAASFDARTLRAPAYSTGAITDLYRKDNRR